MPACEICDDTKWKTISVNGVSRVTRCDCWFRTYGAQLAELANIPARYAASNFENFYDYNQSLRTAAAKARRFAESFPVVDKGFLFIGRPGLGKTHLAIACLKFVAERMRARVAFHDTRELLRVIRQTYHPQSRHLEDERDVIEPVVGADLMVLDDIGAEKTSEWVEETLHLIVNTRYNEKRPTIFTTNYPLEAPVGAKHAETLPERVGFRMYSRLQEMCEFVELEGVDYRELGPNPSPEALAKLDSRGSKSHKDLPSPTGRSQVKARFKGAEPVPDLKWPGGRAGNR